MYINEQNLHRDHLPSMHSKHPFPSRKHPPESISPHRIFLVLLASRWICNFTCINYLFASQSAYSLWYKHILAGSFPTFSISSLYFIAAFFFFFIFTGSFLTLERHVERVLPSLGSQPVQVFEMKMGRWINELSRI